MSYKTYWENYYKTHTKPQNNSRFAMFVGSSLPVSSSILELGCGDGRDALFFAQNGYKVCAIDQASSEIDYLNTHYAAHNENLHFIAGDFTDLHSFGFAPSSFDCIYSRFTLHSIDADAQTRVFRAALSLLKESGIFAIETRGIKNALYGKGEPVNGQADAFIYDNHYRRFVHCDKLVADLNATALVRGGGGDLRFSLLPNKGVLPHLAQWTIILSASFAKRATSRDATKKFPLSLQRDSRSNLISLHTKYDRLPRCARKLFVSLRDFDRSRGNLTCQTPTSYSILCLLIATLALLVRNDKEKTRFEFQPINQNSHFTSFLKAS